MDRLIDRRSLLRLAGTATVFHAGRRAFAGDALRPASAPGWQMRLSTSSLHFSELPIERAGERIAGLGFEAIDIWSAHEGCPHETI
ncbi:MAG: hypothetical protein A2Y76_01080 [Planctomycetes bacterium RBG_13_60_9]|nr:MAG: hypothetical protein A2Y76_01080 [Planctomycetes bacterium RBG_13_60_9]